MKAKLFAVAAAAGLMWMANGLANNDRGTDADSNRTSAYVASAEETSKASSSSPGYRSSKADRRDSSESMATGMGMMEGMKNMMGRMMNGGMMSGGMMDGCPMMGSSQPNKQWRDGGSTR